MGTPVLVKVSYFPNWHASGALGPWRVTPNLMVVVPTSHDVQLTYGATSANYLGLLCTVIGLLGLVGFFAWPRLRSRRGPAGAGARRPLSPSSCDVQRHESGQVTALDETDRTRSV